METVTVARDVEAAPERVRDAIADVESFMRAAGFDEVHVEGEAIRLVNRVGLFEIELDLAVEDRADVALAYRNRRTGVVGEVLVLDRSIGRSSISTDEPDQFD